MRQIRGTDRTWVMIHCALWWKEPKKSILASMSNDMNCTGTPLTRKQEKGGEIKDLSSRVAYHLRIVQLSNQGTCSPASYSLYKEAGLGRSAPDYAVIRECDDQVLALSWVFLLQLASTLKYIDLRKENPVLLFHILVKLGSSVWHPKGRIYMK